MANRKTIKRILGAVGIEPKQISMIEKILRLESDKKRVHSVKLHHGTIYQLGLWADVNLLNNFGSVFEFKAYLAGRGLPQERVDASHDGRTYFLENGGIRAEFKKPVFYPEQ